MTRHLVIIAVFAGLIAIGATSSTITALDGKTIFKDNKCTNCHTIKAQAVERTGTAENTEAKPPDLSGVGTKHDAAWITKWLMKEETQNGKKHLKKFKGSDDDLQILAKWLSGLKQK
jgi:hypothetical protein